MLEGIAVVLRIVIKLIRIGEEIATGTERITTAHIRTRKAYALGLLDGEDILRRAVERFAHFITNIRVCILIRNDLHGILDACRSVIRGEDEREAQFSCAA